MKNIEAMKGEIKKILDCEPIYCRLYRKGPWASVTSRVVIDNRDGVADEVVARLVAFVDVLIEQIRRDEPDYPTDYAALVADGQRMQFDVAELTLDSDEPEWQRWMALRERFLTGGRLEFEHQFISDPDDKPHIRWGVPRLLADLLEDGVLAKWVTLTVIQDNGDYRDWHEFRRPYHQDVWEERARNGYEQTSQLFWMNGLFEGRYVVGEVPFVQDDAAMMSISRWRMSFGSGWNEWDSGIRLALGLNTPPELFTRAVLRLVEFRNAVGCSVAVVCGDEDVTEIMTLERDKGPLTALETFRFVQSLYDEIGFVINRPTDEALAAMLSIPVPRASASTDEPRNYRYFTNAQAVQFYLNVFSRMRAFFTDAEAAQITALTENVQEPLLRHAAERYTEEEIQLYRFGISILAIVEMLGRYMERKEINGEGAVNEQPKSFDAISEGFRKEVDKLNIQLQEKPDTVSEDHRKELQAELNVLNSIQKLPKAIWEKTLAMPEELTTPWEDPYDNTSKPFPVGMNDLSHCEAENLYYMWNRGLVLCISDLTLYSREDVLRLQALMEELSEIARLARESSAEAYEWKGADLFLAMEYGTSIVALMTNKAQSDASDEPWGYYTGRESAEIYRNYSAHEKETNRLLGDAAFESMDMGTHARLRLRWEDGRVIREVSMLD